MVTANDLRGISEAGSSLLGSMMESRSLADCYVNGGKDFYGERFIDSLYEVQRCSDEYQLTQNVAELFAAVCTGPILLNSAEMSYEPSTHAAIRSLGESICFVAAAVVEAARPNHFQPGVEQRLPDRLFPKEDMLAFVDAAVTEFLNTFPALNDLNRLQVLREQELARAIQQTTEDDIDGPCGVYQWRYKGQVTPSALQPAAWKMTKYLWNKPERSAKFDELLIPVYGDREHIADENAFGSLRRAANTFFRANRIPCQINIRMTVVSLTATE